MADDEIKLTAVELMIAGLVGTMRRVTSIKERIENKKHSTVKSDWGIDIDGAAAEMAIAKHFGIYWDAANRSFKRPDVGTLQVRSTEATHLIIRRNDADDEVFVLVITHAPMFYIVGWCHGRDAKQPRFWREDSWWVPRTDEILQPISFLMEDG